MRRASITLFRAGLILSVALVCGGEKASAMTPDFFEVGHDSELAVAWNELAYEVVYAEDQFLTFKGQRAMSMMHLAIHDALNTIEQRYERYACTAERTAAHPVAAAAQAAYDVLASQYPDRRATLNEELAVWLDAVPEGKPKWMGIALGRTCAVAILAIREGDGWDEEGSYDFRDDPGAYRTTGSWDGIVLQPGFGSARPFVLEAPDQFRPAPPPLPGSTAFEEAVDEVRSYGAANSVSRSADQTGYAVWWMEFSEGSVNRLARQLAEERAMDLWKANRMLAQVNVALYDSYIAVWDSKFEYNHWRPVTAIRMSAGDGDVDATGAGPWKPLRPTPPFPEYASAHAAGCAASFSVLEHTFGDRVTFTMETITAPPDMPARSFNSFSAAAAECADSRIRLGWHFRYATDAGLALGRRVTEYLLDNRFRELKDG